ncbi:hypothetical protein LTR91_018692 [Friedmanniomyces endolithicus]|uniref:Catalase core domain-containing protein n=2 Tax=Friedmanniomyces endolithicus TaxID=329885 RepID=A0AAN6K228_9PEZI|nr:hypothetical protein LTR57_000072 [Friedmanniomyces endolithicus]KAK0957021.1 hypothetical protein LTS01_022546 [Friedmanniomyces endolithicus]KAK0964052.1 hypothetical protein LTR91_018692 [Friedmanniomyces endolithicus]KAK1022837.1 hypothetical protein LTS16_025393 [Friedmanniomyces endolithicus]
METMKSMSRAVGAGEPRGNRMAHMMSANEGPMDIIAKVSGHVKNGIREDDGPYFTNNEGIPLPDPEHSKTIGGIPIASDVHLFQKQQHFNRSKLAERAVHPCGSGAFGYFETTADVSDMTKADFLQHVGAKTPIFMRFSTVTLGRNYDIVGLNFPVFFCRDPIQGPDVIRSQARNPKNFFLDYDATFDLLGATPEGNHAGLMFFSDHGTPDGWINEHGYGCHAFKWVNKKGEFVYIKYHFLAKHGQKQLTEPEAIRISGENPDYSKMQLWDAIEAGEEVEWTAKVQIMKPEEADAEKLGFDPFDVTKVWPRKEFPMHEFGKLVLNKNPENYHRDVEQAAFSPGSMVPGIEDSPDPLLQFRMFFYRDAQYHRIGSLSSLNFDGAMRVDGNHSGNKQYAPNSFMGDRFRPDVAEAPYKVSDNVVSRKSHYYHEGKMSEYDQPRDLYRNVMTEQARKNLHHNTAKMLSHVNFPMIQQQYLAQIYNIAPEYARGVYDLTKFKHKQPFEFSEVEAMSEQAPLFFKNVKFRPSQGNRLVGFAPDAPFYNV